MVWCLSAVKQVARSGKDAVKHRGGQPAGIGIQAAAVVRIKERPFSREPMFCAMGECEPRGLQSRGAKHGLVSNAAERNHDRACRQHRDFAFQVVIAAVNLLGQRLVAWRQALHGIADPAIYEAQAVIGRNGLRPGRKSKVMQRAIQEYPGMVAREGPPGAICAMQAWREADHEQPMARAPEGRHRTAVIVWVTPAHAIEKTGEARAAPAVRIEWRALSAHQAALSAP
jgi:hypothetical protein